MKFSIAAMGVLTLCLLMTLDVFSPPPLLPLALGLACAGFLLVGRGPNTDIMHPVRVFGSLWCFLLVLSSLRLLPTVTKWETWTWVLLLTALLTFILGFWLGGPLLSRGQDKQLSAALYARRLKTFLPEGKTIRLALLCIMIGTLVLAYEDYLIGSIPILSSNPDLARMKLFVLDRAKLDTLTIKLIHPFVEFVKYGAFLPAILLFQGKIKSRKVKVLCVVLIVAGTLIYTSQGARGFAVQIVVVLLVLHHYLRKRIRLIRLGVAGFVLLTFLGVFGAYRIKKSRSAPMFERALSTSRFPRGDFWAGPAFAYFTVTSSFQVFNNLTTDLHFYTKPPHGFLLYAFHSLIPRSSIGKFDKELYTGQTTTPTFLAEFYADFGFLGVLLGPLILGVGYGRVYSWMKRGRGLYPIYVQALMIQNLVYFPYANLFSDYLTWIFDLVFMFYLIRTLEPRTHSVPVPSAENPQDKWPGKPRRSNFRERPAET